MNDDWRKIEQEIIKHMQDYGLEVLQGGGDAFVYQEDEFGKTIGPEINLTELAKRLADVMAKERT